MAVSATTMVSCTSRFRPDVQQILEQINVLAKLVSRLKVDIRLRRRTDTRRSKADGQIERRHLVHVRTHRDALQVIQQVSQRVLQVHISQCTLHRTRWDFGFA